jgi:predicted MPP superfamily phosphohydrolase
MPTYLQGANPKELREFYNSQKRIAETNFKSNKESGVIGTPKADVEGYDKVINLLEDLETQINVYSVSINQAVGNDFTVDVYNPSKLLTLMKNTEKAVSKQSFSLSALSAIDIEKLSNYADSLETTKNQMDSLLVEIDAMVLRPVDPLDEALVRPTYQVLEILSRTLNSIIMILRAKIQNYATGVAQPVKLGGGLRYNLDEPLSKSAMYQTPPTIPTRYM